MNMKSTFDKISKLRHDITYKYLKIDQVKDYIMGLSERDRQIVIGASIAAFTMILIGTFLIISTTLSSMEKSLEDEIANFDKVLALKDQYQSSFGMLRKIEHTISKMPKDFSLATHLEDLAKKNGVKIDSIGPPRNPAKPNDYYKETQVEVKIKELSLKTLVNFLYEIENSKEFLKITSIRIRPNYSNPVYLDLVFSVSTFSPI